MILVEKEELQVKRKVLTTQKFELTSEAKELTETICNAQTARDYLESQDSKAGKIQARIKLRGLIRKLVSQLDVYPLTDKYSKITELADEPGVYVKMNCRYIDRFRIHFNKSYKHTAIVALKRTFEPEYPLDLN